MHAAIWSDAVGIETPMVVSELIVSMVSTTWGGRQGQRQKAEEGGGQRQGL